MMPRGPALTRAQRLIIYRHAAARSPKAVCDQDLQRHGFPPVHEGSYKGNLDRDGKLFRLRPDLIEKFADGPMKYGDWPKEWKELIAKSRVTVHGARARVGLDRPRSKQFSGVGRFPSGNAVGCPRFQRAARSPERGATSGPAVGGRDP